MIQFKPVILRILPEINYYFQFQNYRTCDFTTGGLFMWASYFKYEYAIFKDTLFIKGVSEINLSETAFSIPIGKLPNEEAIVILSDYCRNKKIKLILSAVPEEVVDNLQNKFLFQRVKLENWSDYLYEIQSLSSLSGKLYNKKRNHINKFYQLYPKYFYEKITTGNISEVISFFKKYDSLNDKDNPVFRNEADMTEFVLQHYGDFDFIGAVIKINTEITGFIVGEILHDTLYIHISKADKDYEGIYEVLNQKFVADMLSNYPNLQYVNKEEDVGDEGLRKSKLSYHPIKLLHKYNIEFQ
ncbi:MAG: phosphatidylglycerol lysyltransferase domain-containing protein [Candidatus Azobacteroides sp.]|nr:phosphatidylglycerol lysyltransferase domain-containing protein [Candidatus Azobacteroides sp.]